MVLLYAIVLKWDWSFDEIREVPSAKFDAIETAALLIWLIKPNFSSSGKLFVTVYVQTAKFLACCQHSNFSKE